MDPFLNRGIEKVNFFLFDNGDNDEYGPTWTNTDLSVLLGQVPTDEEEQSSQFYQIDETNHVIKKLMKKNSQIANYKSEYFKQYISKASTAIFKKCEREYLEFINSRTVAEKEVFNSIKGLMTSTLELAKVEIGGYLDYLFDQLEIFKVISLASEIAKEKQLGEGGKLAIMYLTKEILN